jgi:hypothetical protein
VKAKEILIKSADLIETGGWIRGEFEKGNKHCLVGAICKIATGDPYSSNSNAQKAYECISKYLASKNILPHGTGLTYYNDTMAKSGKEVVRVLRNAAEEC